MAEVGLAKLKSVHIERRQQTEFRKAELAPAGTAGLFNLVGEFQWRLVGCLH